MKFFKRVNKPQTLQRRYERALVMQLRWKRVAVVFMFAFVSVFLFLLMIIKDYNIDLSVTPTQADAMEATDRAESVEVKDEVVEETRVVSEPVQVVDPIAHIKQYRTSINGTMNDEYLDTIYQDCGSVESTERVMAIATAECGMNPSKCNKVNNSWGWFYGGDRNYDPDVNTMSTMICNGINNYYLGVESNKDMAIRYTGGDRVDTWLWNVNSALSSMRSYK